MLGPRVDGHVRFRDNDHSANAMRAEGVKNVSYDRAVASPDCFQKQFLQCRRIVEQLGIAPVQLKQHVAGERSVGFHAINWRRASTAWVPRVSASSKMEIPLMSE